MMGITEKKLRYICEAGHWNASEHDLNPPYDYKSPHPAAVLIPVIARANGPHIILTKRSPKMKHHPGQISFPGGKKESADTSLSDTALRETEEEIGLQRDSVEILGKLTDFVTISNYHLHAYFGWVQNDYTPSPEQAEVSEIFEVPAQAVLDAAKFQIHGRRWRGGLRKYYSVPYGPYYIWGATARVLFEAAQRMTHD